MRLLFSGDWHLSVHTLDTVEKVKDEVLAICSKEKVDVFVNLGDLKSDYSPIDGRVFNSAVRIVTDFKKASIPFYLLKGNHDRYNLFTSVSSWLPVLRKAGARVYDHPDVEELDKDTRLAFLPYMNDDKKFKAAAKYLAKTVKGKNAVLTFHQ